MSKNQKNLAPEAICLSCGFCCNGIVFADVKLQAGEDAQRLAALGLPLIPQGRGVRWKCQQPCAAYEEPGCRIYAERPKYCQQFECALLKRLKTGEVTHGQALGIIQEARRNAEQVFQLLRRLGDMDEQKPLAVRFRQTTKRLEKATLDKKTAALYGELTLAMQRLNCALSESFYPG